MEIDNILGRGIVTPLKRLGRDFVIGEGSEAVRSAVRQIMSTRKGELRWRPEFGLILDRLRHKNITVTFLAEIQADVNNTLLQFEPRIEILNVDAQAEGLNSTKTVVRVEWRALVQGNRRNTVLTEKQTTEVTI